MKKLIWGLFVGFGVAACQEQESVDSTFTGNQTVYSLQQASDYSVNGTVTLKEKKDGNAWVEVTLSGTEGNIEHPVHLHLGDITKPDAEVAALLTPVIGLVGVSETDLTKLADESTVSYRELLELNACIKVHLAASGADRDIILAGGNIGSAALNDMSTGRASIGLCKSE
jgi:hypothetical protein